MSNDTVKPDGVYTEMVDDEPERDVSKPEEVEKKCPVCSKLLPAKANLSFHLMLHPWTEKPYSCDHCLYISMNKESLIEHCKTVHPATRRFLCAVCGKQFSNIRSLNKHKPVHAERLPFSCAYCDRRFSEYMNWRQHEVSHKSGKFECETCLVKFTTIKGYNDHRENDDCESKILECCGEVYPNRMLFVQHCYDNHRMQRREEYSCDVCGKMFAFRSHLKMHRGQCGIDRRFKAHKDKKRVNFIAVEDSTEKSATKPLTSDTENQTPQIYKCEHCDRVFYNRNWLVQHRRVHLDPNFTTCQICHKKYASYSALYYHKQITHLNIRRHKCTYCDKAFPSGQSLRDHLTSHTGEQPYPCNYCPKRFRHRSSVIEHLRIHTGERPYKCSYCELTFKRRNAKQSHERCHTGEKPFKCRICDRCFAQDSTWRSHEKTHKAPFSCTLCNLAFDSKDSFLSHKAEHTETVLEEVSYIACENQPVEVATDVEGNVYVQYQIA